MSCEKCEICEDQPPHWEHTSVDGIFIKQMYIKDQDTIIPQHAHVYDHTSMLATGAIEAWADDQYLGKFEAPMPIFIKAKVKHTFRTLTDNTLIYCVHNVAKTKIVQIYAEHQLPNAVFKFQKDCERN